MRAGAEPVARSGISSIPMPPQQAANKSVTRRFFACLAARRGTCPPTVESSERAEASAHHMRIETSRLIVRTFEPSDADAWISLVNDPEVRRFTPPGPDATLESFRTALERRRAMEEAHGYA